MQLLVNHFLVAEIFMTSHTRKLAPWDPLLWLSTAKIESRQLWTILLNAFCLTTQGISCSAKWSSNILDHPSRQTVTGLTCWQQNTFMDRAVNRFWSRRPIKYSRRPDQRAPKAQASRGVWVQNLQTFTSNVGSWCDRSAHLKLLRYALTLTQNCEKDASQVISTVFFY